MNSLHWRLCSVIDARTCQNRRWRAVKSVNLSNRETSSTPSLEPRPSRAPKSQTWFANSIPLQSSRMPPSSHPYDLRDRGCIQIGQGGADIVSSILRAACSKLDLKPPITSDEFGASALASAGGELARSVSRTICAISLIFACVRGSEMDINLPNRGRRNSSDENVVVSFPSTALFPQANFSRRGSRLEKVASRSGRRCYRHDAGHRIAPHYQNIRHGLFDRNGSGAECLGSWYSRSLRADRAKRFIHAEAARLCQYQRRARR